MNVLVTGVTGYVGSRLVPALQRAGHQVRGLSRHPPTVNGGVQILAGDAVSGRGLEEAMADVQVAYFLIHSMEAAGGAGPFGDRERRAAENFARAAQSAGVERIVYLGGLVPTGGPASAHLKSRLAVEEILLQALPESVAFRASIVIGAGSSSFRFLVRLIERLPLLAVPAWHSYRTTPIDERDVTEMLARAASSDKVGGQSLDIGGPDIVTYGELIEMIREEMLVDRPTITLDRLTATPIASHLASVIAGEDHALIGPLMESLDNDLLPRDGHTPELLGVRIHSLRAAVERALRDWEAVERLAAR